MLAPLNPKINSDRLWKSLMDLAQIGATEKGGVKRLALTELDGKARDTVVSWFKDAGMTVRIDRVGNIFARRAGRKPDGLPVATGSHIDTQPSGGKFDGNYGVLAGLEVVRTLNDNGIETEYPIEVCVWTNEEGSRFTPVMMGSGVWAGVFTAEHALSQKDLDGHRVEDELRSIGYLGPDVLGPGGGQSPFKAYFEAHIEQGPVLEDANLPIGIVTGALGQRWFDVVITGMEAHAGPTPMNLRKDALLASSVLVQEVNEIAMAEQPHGRGTVGFMRVFPNSRNVIPGQVTFSVDFRHPNDQGLDRMHARLKQACDRVRAQYRVAIELKIVSEFAASAFDTACVDAVRAGATAHGFKALEIVSGAAHDAVYVSRVCPTGMIFIPCKDGISHNEIEDALPEHVEAGCNVLLSAMLRMSLSQ
jgi:beta-ureidopropionase / N-carbamoyl-L-amino-acid hydrolase